MLANHRLKLAGVIGSAAMLIAGAAYAQDPSATLLTLDFSGPLPPFIDNPGPATAVEAPLVVGSTGTYYGVDVDNVVFGMSSQGTLTPIYSFFLNFIAGAISPLTLASDGNLYGTSSPSGAESGYETAFRLTTTGALTTIYALDAVANPEPTCTPQFGGVGAGFVPVVPAGLVQGSDGNLYGVGIQGINGGLCGGTVFKMTLDGALTLLHVFIGPDGIDPESALIEGTDGNFYGTASKGGAMDLGTVFQITPAGAFTTLHSFSGTDGATPMMALVQGKDGNLYGTTSAGGASNLGTIFSIAPTGKMSVLYSFTGQADGENPNGLTLGSDGNFYGTTRGGGESNCMPPMCQADDFGTIFMITSGGALSTLYTFDNADGETPYSSLVQGPDGNFYGSTSAGGFQGVGTLFKISTGLEAANQAVPPPPTNVSYSIDANGNPVVSWSAVAGATSYSVYAGTDSGGMGDVPVATSTTTSATLTKLPPGTTDDFKVAWVNASGTSGLSALAGNAGATTTGTGGRGAIETWMLVALGATALIAITQRARRIRRWNAK